MSGEYLMFGHLQPASALVSVWPAVEVSLLLGKRYTWGGNFTIVAPSFILELISLFVYATRIYFLLALLAPRVHNSVAEEMLPHVTPFFFIYI